MERTDRTSRHKDDEGRGRPVKFQFGFEYSVVAQDDFGTRAQIKFNVIPVVESLFKKPIFGGN